MFACDLPQKTTFDWISKCWLFQLMFLFHGVFVFGMTIFGHFRFWKEFPRWTGKRQSGAPREKIWFAIKKNWPACISPAQAKNGNFEGK